LSTYGLRDGSSGDGSGPGPEDTASSSASSFSQESGTQLGSSLSWLGADGTGQTIGLLEFDTFRIDDVKDYLALIGHPASEIARLSQLHVNGGATLGPEESEVLIDIIAVMLNATGAKVV